MWCAHMASEDVYPYGQPTFWRNIRNDSCKSNVFEIIHPFFDYIICLLFFVCFFFVFAFNRSHTCTLRVG